MPEFAAPGLGRQSNVVTLDMECNEKANGVLYALGGSVGWLVVYMDQGQLVYLYNMMIIEQYEYRSPNPMQAGKHSIVIDTSIAKPGAPGEVVVTIDGAASERVALKRTVQAAFTASETLDIGRDLGSTVWTSYYDRRPFAFEGKIRSVKVQLK